MNGNWRVIAEEAEIAKHEYLHLSKCYILNGAPVSAQGALEQSQGYVEAEEVAWKKWAMTLLGLENHNGRREKTTI